MRISKYDDASFAAVPEEARLESLRRQIRLCAEAAPFYTYLKGAEMRGFDDLARLPFVTAEDIRRSGTRMVCVPASQIRRIVSLRSSGTSDVPKRLYFTEGDLERTVEFFREGMGWMCSPGDKTAILLPCASPWGVGQLLREGLERLGAVPLCFGVPASPEAMDGIAEARPDVLVGMPWQVRLLALRNPELRPKTVLLSADYVPEAAYRTLPELWGCDVLCHFGMTETGYGGAVESPEHRGMALRRDELFAEVVDPETGDRLPFGETGELVLTTLRREAMPLIRCRTGDLVRMTDDGCIDRVFGRIAADRRIYDLQEALFPLPWLWDYRAASGALLAHVSEDAPVCCTDILAERLALAGLGGTPVTVGRLPRSAAAPLYTDKRI